MFNLFMMPTHVAQALILCPAHVQPVSGPTDPNVLRTIEGVLCAQNLHHQVPHDPHMCESGAILASPLEPFPLQSISLAIQLDILLSVKIVSSPIAQTQSHSSPVICTSRSDECRQYQASGYMYYEASRLEMAHPCLLDPTHI